MRNHRLVMGALVVVGALSVGLTLGAWPAAGQEASPGESVKTGGSVKASNVTNAADVPALPPIPMFIITQVASYKVEADKVGLTQKQREELTKFATVHHQQTSKLQRVQVELERAGVKNHRCQRAVTQLIDEANAEGQLKAQSLFTAEQLAKLRQAHRQQIQQVALVAGRNQLPPSTIGMPPLDTQFGNSDLLSILELPEIQQALSITDEQWQRIEAVKKEAYPAARQTILKAAEAMPPIEPASDTSLPKAVEQFTKENLELLTQEQRTQYQQLLQQRQAKFSAAPAVGTGPLAFKSIMPHGAPVQMSSKSVGAEVSIEVTLNDAFADAEVRDKLKLSETQQEEFARRLAEFKPTVVKLLQDQHRAAYEVETARVGRLRELVLAHNAESQKQLADLLTAEQQAQLKKECWKSLGWAALLKPEVSDKLQLTDEQRTLIDAQLKKPGPAAPNLAVPGASFEDFKKQSDEFHRKVTEHHAAIHSTIWSQLTPDQQRECQRSIGLTPPRKPVTVN